MSTDQTRTAILNAAEMLFAERSFSDVTLRDIVAEAGVNLAAVNYHFGTKDELLAQLFVARTTVLNRERLNELKAAEQHGGGRASVDAILRALVTPPLRWHLDPELQRSAAARFLTRASIERVPPIKRIVDREFRHLQRFADALQRALPEREPADIYWGMHFATAMVRQTVTDNVRLERLSGGACDVHDTAAIVGRIVDVASYALTNGGAQRNAPESARRG